jgi:hypothetical protein
MDVSIRAPVRGATCTARARDVTMIEECADVLRAATAIQFAVFELEQGRLGKNIAMPAIETCLNELTGAVWRLKRVVS